MTTSSPNTRPASKVSLKPAQITGYLAGAVGTAALFGVPQAEAAVTAVSFGFGTVLDVNDGNQAQAVTGGSGSYGFIQPTMFPGFAFFSNAVYEDQSSNAQQGTLKFFAPGTVIGNGTNGNVAKNVNGYPRDVQAFMFHDSVPALNFSGDQLNKNIGFVTSTNNWGWANVSWDNTARALTFNSAFVESVAGNSITIPGAVPEPSRALLALAGLGGVALRRRRKQAA